jgi:hypothetical protein
MGVLSSAIVFIALACGGALATDAPLPFEVPAHIAAEAESILRSDCGEVCVASLHDMLGAMDFAHNASDKGTFLKIFADKALQQVEHAERLQKSFHVSMEAAVQKRGTKQSLLGGILSTDTACASNAACKLKSMMANKCKYGREALQLAYQGLNIAAHVMGVVITLLCGCLFVHSTAVCVLQSVPPICIFPYNV